MGRARACGSPYVGHPTWLGFFLSFHPSFSSLPLLAFLASKSLDAPSLLDSKSTFEIQILLETRREASFEFAAKWNPPSWARHLGIHAEG